MFVTAYLVRKTDAAVALVTKEKLDNTAKGEAIRPLWLPIAKMLNCLELDEKSVDILTAQDGQRVGIPVQVEIDDSFAAKVGLK